MVVMEAPSIWLSPLFNKDVEGVDYRADAVGSIFVQFCNIYHFELIITDDNGGTFRSDIRPHTTYHHTTTTYSDDDLTCIRHHP